MTKHAPGRLLCTALALLLGGCGGGSDRPAGKTAVTPYLNVSVSDFYFGTRDVGTTATQSIELANRSGDLYPINELSLHGINADEFELNFTGGITLKPSEKVAIDVSFSPLSEGLKNADIKIDYDIVSQVSAADNLNEQLYYEARSLEEKRNYPLSLRRYSSYIQSDPVTLNKQRAAIKVPVLNESQKFGEGVDFNRYVSAINYREDGRAELALQSLDTLLQDFPDSYLADDALYMQGYIELVDKQNYPTARSHMARLQQQYPDSSYLDTALYSEALALEEQGDTEPAVAKYYQLLQRHRSQSWAALSLNLAKDNMISRLWFDRANQALDRLEG